MKVIVSVTPLPTSPIRGEVPVSAWGTVRRPAQRDTLPLVGRVGEGVATATAARVTP
jgi:hypothetical protein